MVETMQVEPAAVARWLRRWRLACGWTAAAVVVITVTGGGNALASAL